MCDYFTDEGEILVDLPEVLYSDIHKISTIDWMILDENGELMPDKTKISHQLCIGRTSYFSVTFSESNIIPQWRIKFVDESKQFTEEEIEYYEGLIKLTPFDNTVLALKPGKASSLKGKRFILSVSDANGDYLSSIELEVA